MSRASSWEFLRKTEAGHDTNRRVVNYRRRNFKCTNENNEVKIDSLGELTKLTRTGQITTGTNRAPSNLETTPVSSQGCQND